MDQGHLQNSYKKMNDSSHTAVRRSLCVGKLSFIFYNYFASVPGPLIFFFVTRSLAFDIVTCDILLFLTTAHDHHHDLLLGWYFIFVVVRWLLFSISHTIPPYLYPAAHQHHKRCYERWEVCERGGADNHNYILEGSRRSMSQIQRHGFELWFRGLFVTK
jgi:hypothetical protein